MAEADYAEQTAARRPKPKEDAGHAHGSQMLVALDERHGFPARNRFDRAGSEFYTSKWPALTVS
jgi:hypothetical protein